MATRFQFIDDSGETRLAGFLVPDPSGVPDPITTRVQIESTDTVHTLIGGFAPVGFTNPSLVSLSDNDGFNGFQFGANGSFSLQSVDGSTSLRVNALSNTVILEIFDNLGFSIFQVRRDGSLHGKTGQSLTFDL